MRLPDRLYERLAPVRSAGVITGAGVSAESGIATYRGEGGIYDDPEEGDRTVGALTGSTLQSDPDRTWRVVAALARASRGAKPNAAHLAIAEIERKLSSFVLLTQNVDGLHQLAGSKNVIDIHGSVRETLCMSCSASGTLEALEAIEAAPRCPSCDGVLRPNAVLFGELLPEPKLRRIYDEFHAEPPDLVLVAGTTAMFPYIAEPIFVARGAGRLTVEINPEPTLLSDVVDFSIRARAGEALPEIAGILGS
jgi:NAD-dependent deacetylase